MVRTGRSLAALVLFVAGLTVPIGAQAKKSGARAVASIEGDVYLTMKSGDTKRGSGRIVWLLSDPKLVKLRASTSCASAVGRIADLARWKAALVDSEGFARSGREGVSLFDVLNRRARIEKGIHQIRREADDSVARDIALSVVDSSGTGMNAHYAFPSIAAGDYALYSQWTIGENRYFWFAPFTVSKGQRVRRDLDNSAIDDSFGCPLAYRTYPLNP